MTYIALINSRSAEGVLVRELDPTVGTQHSLGDSTQWQYVGAERGGWVCTSVGHSNLTSFQVGDVQERMWGGFLVSDQSEKEVGIDASGMTIYRAGDGYLFRSTDEILATIAPMGIRPDEVTVVTVPELNGV